MARSLCIALLAFGVAACSDAAVGRTSEPVLGGAPDNDDNSVVAIIVYSSNAPQGFNACSGTVVSPHVVLTAAHCVDPDIVGAIDHVQVFLGNDFTDPAQVENGDYLIEVAQTSFDPAFTGFTTTPSHDLGLVVTTTALSLAPMPINHDSLSQGDVGAALHVVGFGESVGGDNTSAGPRRELDTTLAELTSEHIILADVVCEGDSGGPSFMNRNGKATIVGVHSFTTVDNCIGEGDDTRVDVYASSFIDPVINQADPGFLSSGCNTSGGGGDATWMIALALAACAKKPSRRSRGADKML